MLGRRGDTGLSVLLTCRKLCRVARGNRLTRGRIAVRFRVLGVVDAVGENGAHIPLGPRKQRLLLAVLACRPGEAVPTADLLDALWGESPPPSAADNLRGYVQGLRKAVGVGLIVGRRRTGYALAVDPSDVDSVEFVRSARDGAAALRLGDTDVARSLLHHALGLWRGRPFADVESVAALVAESARLEEHRLTALEDRIDADLRCVPASQIVPELDELTRRHPFRERLYGLLMVALYRCGRQADALAAYRRAREALIGDLGIEPGEELRRTEQAVLRRDPWLESPAVEVSGAPPRVVPAELPAGTSGFVARDAELARLDELTAPGADSTAAPVVAIVGVAGVGKTALAIQWARRAAGRFPDGQLFLDLRGFHPGVPVQPAEALGRLLRTFEVEPARAPLSTDEAAALLRSILAHRRVLLVLDNAASAEQVRPLLPGSPDCVVLVTSRNRMTGLVDRNAAGHLTLEPLSCDGAAELLRHVLEPALVREEPTAVAELARVCGYLPLALRIAAASVAERPGWSLARYVAVLSGADRLDALRVDGDDVLAVRAAFDLSYAALTPSQQRMFRLIGLVPGPDVTPAAAAALTGYPADEARHCLDRLAAGHLVQHRAAGRFGLHDLIREYARTRALDCDAAEDREAAVGRLLAYYVETADEAACVVYPDLLRLPFAPPAPTPRIERAEALAYLGAELPNLVAACGYAAEHGPTQAACLIANALRGYCRLRGNVVDWATTAQAARRAAVATGDPAAEAFAALSLALCAQEAGDLPTATGLYDEALLLSRRAEWPVAEAAITSDAATVYIEQGDLDRAIACHRAALAAHRRSGDRCGEALALNNVGLSCAMLGRLADAHLLLTEATILARADGYLVAQTVAQTNLAEVLLLMDRRSQARAAITEARRVGNQIGRQATEIYGLILLSDIAREDGDATAALAHATAARELTKGTQVQVATCVVHRALAAAYEALGEHWQAVAYYRIAHRLAATVRSRYNEIEALAGLVVAEHRVGEPGAAQASRRALDLTRTIGYRVLEGRVLAALAEISLRQGQRAVAAEQARLALGIQDDTGWKLGRSRLRHILATAGDGT
jgi:DNA-binding SARP family transcriptional activator/tetratricopeptide (TPR) repeat protein